jgi:uncharacterized protein (TIGR00251 family)
MTAWIKDHPKGSTLSLYIQPGSSKTMISGEHGERLKIKIKAQPQDGEANECLIEFLSEKLKIAKSGIHLIQGESSRQKVILVELPPQKIISELLS